MKRFLVTAVVAGLCVGSMGVKGLRVPRGHRHDPPKTAADQEKENEARRQKEQEKQQVQQPPQQSGKPTTAPSTALAKAQVGLEQVERRLWAGFEKGADYVKAQQDLKGAQDGYDAAYRAMVGKLGERPEYGAAVERQREAEEKMKGAKGGAGAAAAAAEVMAARTAVHKMEAEAAEKDEAVKGAKGKVAEAKGVIDGLRKGFAETIKSDPDYVAAEKAVEEAKGQVGKKA
jgi:hypothetical protein